MKVYLSRGTRLTFNITWLMEILRIFREDALNKVLSDEFLNIDKNLKYVRYQCGLASVV